MLLEFGDIVASDIKSIISQAMALRSQRRFQQAYELIAKEAIQHESIKRSLWEHEPVFWSDINAGICQLTRRNGADAAFIEQLWGKPDFLYSFHRHAGKFPNSRQELVKILEREFVSNIGTSHALHWIVRDRKSQPWGILSLVDISLLHRRAEVLLGVLPDAPLGLSTAAMLTLFQFYFRGLKFNKLYSLVYDDNPHSLKGTLHLGFNVEGRLRKHVLDPKSGTHINLVQTGLLAEDAFTPRNERLMRRLLAPK